MYIFEKLYNQRKKLYIFGTLSLALNFIDNGVCIKMYSFFQTCTNSVVLICIFLKSCTTIKKLYSQRKKLYVFGTLSLAPNFIEKFIDNDVGTKNVQFFPKLYKFCGPHMYIFEKLYNQRKKLYIFGTLSLAPNFIDDGVCTKMYSFFESCTNSVVLICIFLKSCTTNKKLYNQRKKLYIFGTLSLAPNFIDNGVYTKCTVFSKPVQILWSSYVYFQKAVQPLKSCTTKEKSCTSLVHCPWLLISLTMVFV